MPLIQTIHHRTLVLFAIAFVIGIAVTAAVHTAASVWMSAVVLVAGVGLLARVGHRRSLAVIAISLLGIGCGSLRYTADRLISPDDVGRWAGEKRVATVTGVIVSDPVRLPGRYTCTVSVTGVEGQNSVVVAASGRMYVTIGDAALRGIRPTDAAEPPVQYADIVELHGPLELPLGATNPGAFSWRDYLSRRGIYCELLAKRPGGVVLKQTGGNNLALSVVYRLRRSLLQTIGKSLSPTHAALLDGILIGQRVSLPPDLAADFVHTGTVHILASAGLHVGIITLCLWFLMNRLTLPRKLSAVAMIALLWVYVVLSGGRPSVTRAALMATIYLGAIVFEREPDVPTSIAAAALAILAGEPSALFESGFQLSFMTVSTLATTMPVWDAFVRPRVDALFLAKWRRPVLGVLQFVGLSIFAQLGAIPIVAGAYNETSLSSISANLLVVPCLFVVIPLGMLGAILGSLWPPLGAPFFATVSPFLALIEKIVRWFGESSSGFSAIVTPSPVAVVAYYAAIGVVAWVLAYTMETRKMTVSLANSEG